MTIQRRNFLKQSSFIAGGLLFTNPLDSLASFSKKISGKDANTLSIVHTNDLHNQLQSLHKYPGLGGMNNISNNLNHLFTGSMLLDAGDFLDDSASFNDHVEMIDAMNRLGYHAATIGNRELQNGEDYLASLLPHMKFPLVNCNYRFSDPTLKAAIQPYIIIKSGKFRIGITGVGPRIDISGVRWYHPYKAANNLATWLKAEKYCDLVICLSHIGYIKSSVENNTEFAASSTGIDVIISGHQQYWSNGLFVCKNRNKEEVIVSHAGERGMIVKQLTITFDEYKKRRNLAFRNFVPGLPANTSAYAAIQEMKA